MDQTARLLLLQFHVHNLCDFLGGEVEVEEPVHSSAESFVGAKDSLHRLGVAGEDDHHFAGVHERNDLLKIFNAVVLVCATLNGHQPVDERGILLQSDLKSSQISNLCCIVDAGWLLRRDRLLPLRKRLRRLRLMLLLKIHTDSREMQLSNAQDTDDRIWKSCSANMCECTGY